MKEDIYQRITNKIIAKLETGVRSWVKPWVASPDGGRIVRAPRFNGQPYSGVNVLMLWS